MMKKLDLFETRTVRAKQREIKVTNVGAVTGGECFLVETEKSAFVYDTGFGFSGAETAANVKKVLGDKPLNAILLTHSHFDHALGAPYIKDLYPEAKVVASTHAAEVFPRDGAKKIMQQMDDAAAAMYRAPAVPVREVIPDQIVSDGDLVDTGDMVFRTVALPGHTWCSVGYYCEEEKFFLSCETIGVYAADFGIIPIFLIGYNVAMDSIRRAMTLDVETILMPHTDLVQGDVNSMIAESFKNSEKTAAEIMDLYRSGADEKQMMGIIFQRYYTDYVRTLTPEAAFALNAGHMVKCIVKDLS